MNENENYSAPNNEKHPAFTKYLILSILEFLFCCWPLGLAGIILACSANSLYKGGNADAADSKFKTAKTCLIIGLVGAIVIIVFAVILSIAGVMDPNGFSTQGHITY